MLRLLVDADIPFAVEAMSRYGQVRTLPGHAIDRAACRHADVLLVRSVTRVDASTLDDTPVRYVGTATAGVDHVDLSYLARRGIPFEYAPGSNAESVVEWVIASLLALAEGASLDGRTIGIVGCGNVGGRLAPRAVALGLRVLECDPPLADEAAASGLPHPFVPYQEVLEESDILSFHTPLTFDGRYATFHLLGMEELRSTRPGVWILNSSRGAVVDGPALEASIRSGHVGGAALDVWEDEPTPASTLVDVARIATPHIAGYSYDAKVAGSAMMEDAIRAWLVREGHSLPSSFDWSAAAPAAAIMLDAPPVDDGDWLGSLVSQAYDVRADDGRFRAGMLDPGLDAQDRATAFANLRRQYPMRRSWRHHAVRGAVPSEYQVAVRAGLLLRPA